MKKIIALFFVLIFSFTQVSYAEGVEDAVLSTDTPVSTAPAPSAENATGSSLEELSIAQAVANPEVPGSAPALDSETAPTIVSETATASVVQDAALVQEGAIGTLLEDTINPESASSSDTQVVLVASEESTSAVVVIPEETSVPISDTTVEGESSVDQVIIADTPLLEVVDTDLINDASQSETAVSVDTLSSMPSLTEVALVDTNTDPGPEFSFALTGKHIPTERDDDNTVHTTVLTPAVDNETGAMQVSGRCNDAYYVVLLFKHQDDYKNDPRSYVVNRAYPCENGSFSYSISDLPTGLPDGVYYLLVGQQGESGPWKPITELTEITVTNNRR